MEFLAADLRENSIKDNMTMFFGLIFRHMVKLRELNGLEILHSCMKLIT